MPLKAVTFRAVVLALLLGILGTGVAFLVVRIREPAARVEIVVPPAGTGSGSDVAVYVSGAVGREGVYTLEKGSRVVDAIDAAGGLAPEADRRLVNLAARLADEQHIHVPRLGEAPVPVAAGQGAASAGMVNINTGTTAEIERLEGIGPVLAAAIVEYREAHGPFTRIEDLLKVPRLGEGTLARIRPYISL